MLSRLYFNIILYLNGIVLPVFLSYKALKANQAKESQKWLVYWIVLIVFIKLLDMIDFLVRIWMPCYDELTLLILLWLINRKFNGAGIVYDLYLKPFLAKYEGEVESFVGNVWSGVTKVGLQSIPKSIHVILRSATELSKKGAGSQDEQVCKNSCDTVTEFYRQILLNAKEHGTRTILGLLKGKSSDDLKGKKEIRYLEGVSSEDNGVCAICSEEFNQGDTVARLDCSCVYHKLCVEDWFHCPKHPLY